MEPIKKIFFCPYTLTEKRSRKIKKGLLLKIEFKGGLQGYSHSFEEDFRFLKKRAQGLDHPPSLKTSFFGAWLDAKARALKKNLLEGLPSITNHYLIPDLSSFKGGLKIPFSVVKVKMKSPKETPALKKLIEKNPEKKFRLDFNYQFSLKDWEHFEHQNKALAPMIDFIEDPFPEFWKKPSKNFHFALDFGPFYPCPIRVLKPMRFGPDEALSNFKKRHFQRIIFTHALSHPLEARLSFILASRFYKAHPEKKETCGLNYSFDFFEMNDFLSCSKEENFYKGGGFGLGFDSLLEKQNWKAL